MLQEDTAVGSNGGSSISESAFHQRQRHRRYECTFRLSQNPKVHRKKTVKSYHAQHAYRNQTLVDDMWEYLASFATYAGYTKEI